MTFLRSIALTVFCLLMMAGPVAAETAKEISWDNLIPKLTPLRSPVLNLSMDHQVSIRALYSIRDLEKNKIISRVDPEYEQGVEIKHELTSEGLDVELLLEQFAQLISEFNERNKAAVEELDGQLVRMPGYALPLEHSDTAVKEMLLVPDIGACIHTPPPPPNQTVYVKLKDGYKAESLYEPVWITGRMKVTSTKSSVAMSDGIAPVESIYTLDGIKVEPYTF